MKTLNKKTILLDQVRVVILLNGIDFLLNKFALQFFEIVSRAILSLNQIHYPFLSINKIKHVGKYNI